MVENAFITLAPTGPKRGGTRASRTATRPSTLDGACVGLVANGKSNSVELLDYVYEELAARFDLRGALRVRKDSVSIPPRREDFERIVDQAEVVITALGD